MAVPGYYGSTPYGGSYYGGALGPSEDWRLIAADGTETHLSEGFTSQTGFAVMVGPRGGLLPPYAWSEETVPLQPGARLRDVRRRQRDYTLVLFVSDATTTALAARMAALIRALDPERGDVRLRKTNAAGEVRDLVCRYKSGLEGDDGDDSYGVLWRQFPLTLRAVDPDWLGSSDVQLAYLLDQTPSLFFPILPLRLSSSSVFADATISNAGDLPTWPVWTITGPGADPVLENLTTGERLALTATLGVGEGLVIDTRPGRKTITRSDGSNLFSSLSSDSALWALARGNNQVRIEMPSADANSAVRLAYTLRYLAAP